MEDIVFKSLRMEDHLTQTFKILRKFSMKPNPKKYNFGVESEKFLGHVVSKRGIEVNLTKIKWEPH